MDDDLANNEASGYGIAVPMRPQIVTTTEVDEIKVSPRGRVTAMANVPTTTGNQHSLIDKKKQKWMADKEAADKLMQQETYDKQKFASNRPQGEHFFAF